MVLAAMEWELEITCKVARVCHFGIGILLRVPVDALAASQTRHSERDQC